MKFSALFLLEILFAAVLALEKVPYAAGGTPGKCDGIAMEVPVCARDCIRAAARIFSCGRTNWTCQCAKKDEIARESETCLTKACGMGELMNLRSTVQQLCTCASAERKEL